MRKRELESEVTRLSEAVRRAETQYAMAESNWRQDHYDTLRDAGWSSLDSSATKRNRTWKDIEKNLKDCFEAWCVNPLAKSFCDYMRYFVVGQGSKVVTEDGEDAENRIRAFMDLNDWPILEKKICEELSRDGEVFVRFHTRNLLDIKSSVAAISLIDPLEIRAVKARDVDKPEGYLRIWNQITDYDDNGNPTTESETGWIDASEIIHIKVNTSHNEQRGRSDLLVVLPWLRQLRSWLDDMARRNFYINSINWDVTVKPPITPAQVTAAYPNGLPPGSVIAHTESEVWKPMTPDMRWADSTNGMRAIKLIVMAGYKMPESWYGDTGESNLATTQALTMPTLRAFVDRQDLLKHYWEKIFVKGCGVEDITVQFPEIVSEEMGQKATALNNLSQAVLNFQTAGLMSRETAHEVLQAFLPELDAWQDDESGLGEKRKVELEDVEDNLAYSQGRKAERVPGVQRVPEFPDVPVNGSTTG